MQIHSRYAAFCILCLSITALLWRLLDFFEEAINGSVKMSLGPLLITGHNAAIMQIAIITVLLFASCKTLAQLRGKKTISPPG